MEAKKEEPNEAKLVCYETYAALGAFLFDLAEKGHPQADKLLDNLSEARLVHADVVPFADVASVAPSQAPSSDAAILGWLNPDTGKTCSVDEKHSMEKHQGMPGLHIAKGFRIPLIAAYGVAPCDGSRTE